jgi:hypothetical protein
MWLQPLERRVFFTGSSSEQVSRTRIYVRVLQLMQRSESCLRIYQKEQRRSILFIDKDMFR